jgi:hypothetical protein
MQLAELESIPFMTLTGIGMAIAKQMTPAASVLSLLCVMTCYHTQFPRTRDVLEQDLQGLSATRCTTAKNTDLTLPRHPATMLTGVLLHKYIVEQQGTQVKSGNRHSFDTVSVAQQRPHCGTAKAWWYVDTIRKLTYPCLTLRHHKCSYWRQSHSHSFCSSWQCLPQKLHCRHTQGL